MEDQKNLINDISDELNFLKEIIQSLPVAIYINEYEIQDTPTSCRNIWINERGLDFIKYTQEEINTLGYDFFMQIIHPDDMDLIPISIKSSIKKSDLIIVGTHRLKPKGSKRYYRTCNLISIVETFEDLFPRKLLGCIFLINDFMKPDNQLVDALKEIKRQKNEHNLYILTPREKEILCYIVKGKTDKEIAASLFISRNTAKKHRTNILHKSGAKNSAELVALTVEGGRF